MLCDSTRISIAKSETRQPGLLRLHNPHRSRAALIGRTETTNCWCSASNSTSSTMVFSTPNRSRHNLEFRTPLSDPRFLGLDNPETYDRERRAAVTGPKIDPHMRHKSLKVEPVPTVEN